MNDANAPTDSPQDREITFGVLTAVENDAAVTQRSVARELNIALGLANAYVKRCVRKGLIKVNQIPPNRYLYYLTPQGFAEKTRLSTEYLTSSFTFFRKARNQCAELLQQCQRRQWRRIALLGASELAEIAALCNSDVGLELIAIVGDGDARARFAGLPTAPNLAAAGDIDAVIVTDLENAQEWFGKLKEILPEDRILTPNLLRVVRIGTPPAKRKRKRKS